MKYSLYCSLFIIGWTIGCRDDDPDFAPPVLEEPVTFTTVDANFTDFPPDYSINDNQEGVRQNAV